jgi:hypothetical protein
VGAALKRQHPARQKEHDQIIRAKVGLLLVLLDKEGDPDGLLIVLRIVEPVPHTGWPRNVRRKVDEVLRPDVPDIEKGFLPSPDRLQTEQFVKAAPLAGRKDATPAPDEWFGGRKFPILDRILPEGVKIREVIYSRSDTSVSLH